MKDGSEVAAATDDRHAADAGASASHDLVPFVLPPSAGGDRGWTFDALRADAARRLEEHPDAPRVMVELVLSVSARSRH